MGRKNSLIFLLDSLKLRALLSVFFSGIILQLNCCEGTAQRKVTLTHTEMKMASETNTIF